jgi:type IV secretion system protein VirB2
MAQHGFKAPKAQRSARQSNIGLMLIGAAVGLALSKSASAGGAGNALPWEAPLTVVQNSLTGPVALAVSVIAMAATGAALVFGGEMSDFTRRLIMVVMAISFLVGGAAFMAAVFPGAAGGAVIG